MRTALPRSSALKERSRHFEERKERKERSRHIEIPYIIFVNFFPNLRVVLVFVECHICFLNIGRSWESLC